ncbi:C-C motif chemokine 20 isoform X1 [Salmo trutta]|uniref:C-C motif chemokine n=1 Tax=Salmo trutta TaxID=8032 RepID=A0A674ACA6_SALTR|nr:C-C motif chemokine 20-like isoform X1 [Salmo trutta]
MAQIRAPVIVLLVLLAVGLFTTEASAAKQGQYSAVKARRRKGCCQSYTGGEIPFGVIVGYTLQTPIEICRIPAIIFHTEKGKDLCADPSKSWVIQHVNRLGDRAVHIRKSQS